MDESRGSRFSRATSVWIVAFIACLIGLPLAVTVGTLLINNPFWILLSVVLATILGALEGLSS